MGIEKITIQEIKSIEDTGGNYGPQKKITFIDIKNRYISGWVKEDAYDKNAWCEGKTLDLEISKNGKYTNFRLPSAGASSGASKPSNGDNVWAAIKSIITRLDALETFFTSEAKPIPPTKEQEDDIPF